MRRQWRDDGATSASAPLAGLAGRSGGADGSRPGRGPPVDTSNRPPLDCPLNGQQARSVTPGRPERAAQGRSPRKSAGPMIDGHCQPRMIGTSWTAGSDTLTEQNCTRTRRANLFDRELRHNLFSFVERWSYPQKPTTFPDSKLRLSVLRKLRRPSLSSHCISTLLESWSCVSATQ